MHVGGDDVVIECAFCEKDMHYYGCCTDNILPCRRALKKFTAAIDEAASDDDEFIDVEEVTDPNSCMAVKNIQPRPLIDIFCKPNPDWLALKNKTPPGSDRKFTTGLAKGEIFLDVTLKNPQYFFYLQSRPLPQYLNEYCEWVTQHFEIDSLNKKLWMPTQSAQPRGGGTLSSPMEEPPCVLVLSPPRRGGRPPRL